jgi:predicted CXXCH cytochrome family protein
MGRTLGGPLTLFVFAAFLIMVWGCSDDDPRVGPVEPPATVEVEGGGASTHDYGTNCLKCHGGRAREQQSQAPTFFRGLQAIVHADLLCTTCHEPHGNTTNLRLIREQMVTPVSGEKPTVFSSYDGASSLADGDGTYNGTCEVCHTTTNYHRNDSSGDHTHFAGARCTGCHNHWNDFIPYASDCTQTCHVTTQPLGAGDYRRQIVGSGGDFERASHHVDDGLGGESVTAPDCLVCHNNSRHQTLTDPQVRLFNKDTGSTITYDGTAGSLEPFCTSCHDPDGETLFSDGNSAPDIETDWLLSSHKAGGMTCFGDGVTNGCHASAHGSDKVSLKAPFTGATPDEEAFCYGCHDADGPASSDVEDDFSGTLTWIPGSGSVLNTHHDVSDADQTYSGAVLECNNCHDPHSATPSQKVLGDVDPSDGRVPAPDNTFAGSSYVTEFCFECHDDSYPAGVTPPTTALLNIHAQWVHTGGGDKNDQHGVDDGSNDPNLRPGSGYAQGEILNCEACHTVGHGNSVNLFQLRTTIYSKDGSTPLVSDAGDTLVYVTNIDPQNTDVLTNGQNWCSACHPQPMGGNKDSGCIINCHFHTDRF